MVRLLRCPVNLAFLRHSRSMAYSCDPVLREIEEEDAVWQKKSRRKQEGDIVEDQGQAVRSSSSSAVETSKAEKTLQAGGVDSDGQPRDTLHSPAKKPRISHGFY